MKTLIGSLIAVGALVTGAWAADAAAGAGIYGTKCKSCHGPSGEGNAAVAKMMKVEMKPIAGSSEDAIKAAVTKGAGKMKPVAGVAGADLDNVAAAVHAMKK